MEKQNTITYVVVFIAMLSFSLGFSQSYQKTDRSTLNESGIQSCDKGTQQAIEDAKNNIYKYFSYGLIFRSEADLEFNGFYKKHMKSKYGIVLGNAGCVITAESKCYKEKIVELIQNKFGDKIFEISRQEALKLFEQSKP